MRLPLLALALAGWGAAQGPSDPPPLLQLTRIPAGAKSARNYAAVHTPLDVIGITSITGLPETWTIEPHLTFASIEDLDHALAAVAPTGPANAYGETQDELLGAPRTMIAAYAPGYGYRPGETVRNLPKARYFRISIYRVRPGYENVMRNLVDVRRQSYDRANLDRPDFVYRVISGAPAGTYLVIAPLPSLASIDEALQRLPSYIEPLESPQNTDNLIGYQHLFFRVDPRSSYVSVGFAGEDAAFWRPQKQ